MTSNDPLPALTRVIRQAMGDKLTASDGTFSDMCATDVMFEAPYAPGGSVTLNSRDEVAAYLPNVSDTYQIDELELTNTYDAPDSDVVVIEFIAHGQGAKTGRPYHQRYINVVEIIDGEISRYLDYWNPLIALWTAGDEAISASVAGETDQSN